MEKNEVFDGDGVFLLNIYQACLDDGPSSWEWRATAAVEALVAMMTKIAIATVTLYKWKLYVICVRKSETDKKNSRSPSEREGARLFSFLFYLHGFCATVMRAREFIRSMPKSIKATEMQSDKTNMYVCVCAHINEIVAVVIFSLDYKDISMNFIEPTHLKMFQGA